MLQRSEHPSALRVPLLENGDRLTRVEFERRYEAHPEIQKAELINGRVLIPSRTGTTAHGESAASLGLLLGTYAAESRMLMVTSNSTLRIDEDNEPQPDLILRIDAEGLRASRIDEDGYLEGAPELVAEITASTVSYDLHDKLHVYRRSGVQEYLVWRTIDGGIDWFELVDGEYVRLPADADGCLQSRIFPGLRIDVPALLAGDDRRALATLRTALEAGAHRSLLARLDAAD